MLIIVTIWLLLQLYAGRALAALARLLRLPAATGWLVSLIVAVLPLAATIAYRRNAIDIDAPLQWAGFISMGFASILFFATVAGDLMRLIGIGARRASEHSRWSREFTTRAAGRVAASGAVVAALLTLAGLTVAWRPIVVETEVRIPGLDPRLEGLRIALLSDIHIGPLITSEFAQRVTRMTNRLEPDIVAIAGDLVDGMPNVLAPHVAHLAGIRARHGVFYVTGNHEYYWDGPGWIREASELGWHVLEDSHRILDHDGAPVVMAGVYDLRAKTFVPTHEGSPAAALAEAPEDAFTVLLSHQPQSGYGAEDLGVDLQLSGHTHGGQYFPFNILVHAFQPIVRGLHVREGMKIYVTPGTGFWGPPNRLGSRGRIVQITLRSGTE